jgi:hypothetical protein
VKRVLIITYYWPPAGGSGVQRWLKFVKYLREFGYEPVVYTPLNPEFMAVDKTLLSEIPSGVEVIKREITEPYSIYKLLTGKKESGVKPGFIKSGNGKSKFSERVSLFIRSNLFIPDPKMLWISPSARFLVKHLKESSVDVIVSTGPPHSMHLIAKRVSKATGIPWLADFRDPWTKMYNFKYLGCTKPVEALHKKLERGVIRCADAVVTVTNTIAAELQELNPKRRVEVITNGYDSADFPQMDVVSQERFTITYTGLFVRTQNPTVLWRILGERVGAGTTGFAESLQIRLVGHIDSSVLEDISKYKLEPYLVKMDYMPHNEVIKLQREATVLLLSSGREPESGGIMTGKFFEYLAAGRPILGFGPKGGDMDIALEESRAGEMFDYENYDGVAKWIDAQYALYTIGAAPVMEGDISKYSRRELTKKMAAVLDEICKK